jgi:DNA-binding transcriptional LysR family regulator
VEKCPVVAGGLGIAIVSAAAAADQIALGKLGILKPRKFAVRMLTGLSLPAREPSPSAGAFDALLDRLPA